MLNTAEITTKEAIVFFIFEFSYELYVCSEQKLRDVSLTKMMWGRQGDFQRLKKWYNPFYGIMAE
jgi:hypothetical protein